MKAHSYALALALVLVPVCCVPSGFSQDTPLTSSRAIHQLLEQADLDVLVEHQKKLLARTLDLQLEIEIDLATGKNIDAKQKVLEIVQKHRDRIRLQIESASERVAHSTAAPVTVAAGPREALTPSSPAPGTAQAIESQLIRVRRELAETARVYTEQDPRYTMLKKRVDELEKTKAELEKKEKTR